MDLHNTLVWGRMLLRKLWTSYKRQAINYAVEDLLQRLEGWTQIELSTSQGDEGYHQYIFYMTKVEKDASLG